MSETNNYGGLRAAREYSTQHELPITHIIIGPTDGQSSPTGRAMQHITTELEAHMHAEGTIRRHYPENPSDSVVLSARGEITMILYCDADTAEAILRRAYEGLTLPDGGKPGLDADIKQYDSDESVPLEHPKLPRRPSPLPINLRKAREAYLRSMGIEGLLQLLKQEHKE